MSRIPTKYLRLTRYVLSALTSVIRIEELRRKPREKPQGPGILGLGFGGLMALMALAQFYYRLRGSQKK